MNIWAFLRGLVLIPFLSAFLLAQNANDAIRILQDEMGIGSRALSMGGAYVGVADDYSAIYWNPAGLTAMKQSQFFGELSHLNFNNTATFSNDITEDAQSFTHLRSLGLAVPLPTARGSLVLALGFNRVKDFDRSLLFSGFNTRSNGIDFDLEDEQGNVDTYFFDRNVHQTEQVTDEGGLKQWSFAGAMALSPNFNAGVSLDIWTGEDEYQLTFLQEDVENNYFQFPGDFHRYQLNQTLLTKYRAVGLKFGGMFNLGTGIRIGGAVGLPKSFTVNETYSENDELEFDDGYIDAVDLGSGEFEYKVKTPFHFDGGVSFSNRSVTLAASARYRDWTQTRFDVPDDFRLDPEFAELLEENKFIKSDYRSTVEYRLGGEVNLEGLGTRLRGGYAVFPSPLKDATNDMDKKYITAGLGFLVDRYVTLDVAYMRGTWKEESEDIFTPGGTLENITVNKIFVGFTYRF